MEKPSAEKEPRPLRQRPMKTGQLSPTRSIVADAEYTAILIEIGPEPRHSGTAEWSGS